MSQAPPAAAGRGLILIFAAVALGLILLSQGFDDGAAISSRDGDGDQATVESTVSTETVPPSTISEGVDPSTVPVVVSNASGISGLAGQVTDQLAALGYITAEPETAPELSDFTTVYYLTNFEPEARDVATALGYPPDQVVQLAPEPPPAGDASLQVVFVVLGADAETLAAGGDGATPTTAGVTDDTLLAPG